MILHIILTYACSVGCDYDVLVTVVRMYVLQCNPY